jgi:hypothetical protein
MIQMDRCCVVVLVSILSLSTLVAFMGCKDTFYSEWQCEILRINASTCLPLHGKSRSNMNVVVSNSTVMAKVICHDSNSCSDCDSKYRVGVTVTCHQNPWNLLIGDCCDTLSPAFLLGISMMVPTLSGIGVLVFNKCRGRVVI